LSAQLLRGRCFLDAQPVFGSRLLRAQSVFSRFLLRAQLLRGYVFLRVQLLRGKDFLRAQLLLGSLGGLHQLLYFSFQKCDPPRLHISPVAVGEAVPDGVAGRRDASGYAHVDFMTRVGPAAAPLLQLDRHVTSRHENGLGNYL
jgi:hypothetical protein